MDEIEGIEHTGASPNLKLSVARVAFLPAKQGMQISPIIAGMLAAFRKAQTSTGILKIGGSLSQLTHYRRLSGKLSFSLHPGLVKSPNEIIPSLVRASGGAELILIEGEAGIRDLFPATYGVNSSQEMMAVLGTPSILVIDGEGYRESISSMVRGFVAQDEFQGISGVLVINAGVGIDSQKQSLEQLEFETGVRLVGIVPKTEKPVVDFSDKLDEGTGVSRPRLLNSLELVNSYVNLEVVREIAARAEQLVVPRTFIATKSRVCRVAVADDTAMNEMFQENLDLLRREGAELVAFSPLSDEKLPSHVRSIYLPGGRLERYAEGLSANTAMRDSIRSFVQEGGVVYAEGSSLSYLFSNVLNSKGQSFPMLGLIKGSATYLNQEAETERNIFVAQELRPNFLLNSGESLRGLRPSRWAYRVEEQIQLAFNCLYLEQLNATEAELEENPPIADGFMPRQNVIGTAFNYSWATNPVVAERIVKFALGKIV